ncbi:MAG: gamma-glutamyltransferase [Planctomycetota bacterium]|nr:gamma-glutamyltransferase [Planctomycetota bacterium]
MTDPMSNPTTEQTVCAAGYDRPVGDPRQSRSVVIATNGIVATSHPLAAQVGLDVLKNGGNAADAAIATSAMMGLVEPMSCGIGGDLFVIYWDATTEKLYGLNASGRSPYAMNREVFKDKGLDEIPLHGVLPWSVPGCVGGWEELRRSFGTMSFEKLLQPSIDYAEAGFPVTQIIAGYWLSGEERFQDWPDSAKTYLKNGRAPREGEIFRNPYLATTYRAIARGGRNAFYKGGIAQQIVDFSERNGGCFSMRDFADHTSQWVEPVSTNYRGYDVWELPPNGQGIAALEMLNVLEGFDVKKLGHNSADLIHVFLEAKKLAFADRAKFYADPDFNKLPVTELISKEYGVRQRARIDMQKAATDVDPGDPVIGQGDTIYLTVVDKDRNCCSFIQSNFHGFGSQVVPGDVGFVIQNRGQLFNLDPDHLNTLEPHKRPFHTIIPAFVTKDNKPFFCFGVMGGDMQPQGHVQILMNLIDFGMNVQAAGDAARINHVGSQTPTGSPMWSNGGEVGLESGVSVGVRKELERRGHILRRDTGSVGGYQGILIDWANGTLHGATEVRKDGAAVGY